MNLSYDTFTAAFLAKVSEYDLLEMQSEERRETIDGYLKAAVAMFKKNCRYDLITSQNDWSRVFEVNIAEEDADELIDIISLGMVMQWMRPYLYRQENLENLMNTRDFSLYSPANLLLRIGEAYQNVRKEYTQMIREYSYNHGDLSVLHLP